MALLAPEAFNVRVFVAPASPIVSAVFIAILPAVCRAISPVVALVVVALDTVILPAVLLPINKFPAVTRLSSALVKPKVRDVTVAFPTSLPPTLTKTPLLRF